MEFHDDDDSLTTDNSNHGTTACSIQRYSQKVGSVIPDSPQALARRRFDWAEIAKLHNLGPPQAMTTLAARVHTSPFAAQITRGSCAPPNPEDTFLYMAGHKPKPCKIQEHCFEQATDYLNRREDWQRLTYAYNADTPHGRVVQHTRRTEGQKRGPLHDHLCEFHEYCGSLHAHIPVAQSSCHSAEACPDSVQGLVISVS